jgi:actin-like ATPase involved in cell morphogenesis
MFGLQVKRPMSKGLISSKEIDGLDILALMLKKLIGGKTYNGHIVYSVPAGSIDIENNILYHQGVFSRIFSELGFTSEPFNEALAIVYSQCQDNKFTALALSAGAGMCNICLSYKSVPIISFSVARAGDWVDEQSALSLGTISNRITTIKEKDTDLSNFQIGSKKERRIREAIVYYYKEMIRYSLEKVKQKLSDSTDNLDLSEDIPIVIAGGTSLAKGFIPLFKEIISGYNDFPFKISDIKLADDPLSAIAEGLLIRAMMVHKNSISKDEQNKK